MFVVKNPRSIHPMKMDGLTFKVKLEPGIHGPPGPETDSVRDFSILSVLAQSEIFKICWSWSNSVLIFSFFGPRTGLNRLTSRFWFVDPWLDHRLRSQPFNLTMRVNLCIDIG